FNTTRPRSVIDGSPAVNTFVVVGSQRVGGGHGGTDGCVNCCSTGIHVDWSSAWLAAKLTLTLKNGGVPNAAGPVQCPAVRKTRSCTRTPLQKPSRPS